MVYSPRHIETGEAVQTQRRCSNVADRTKTCSAPEAYPEVGRGDLGQQGSCSPSPLDALPICALEEALVRRIFTRSA